MPACFIAINAGEDGTVVAAKILGKADYGYGYNAQSGEYGDLPRKASTPAKIVRNALQGAASIAGLPITTEAIVAERPSKEIAPPPKPADGMSLIGGY